MNKEQENVRVKINGLIDKYGIKANRICECTNINPAYFCLFRKGKKYLSDQELTSVQGYIDQFKAML